jgi:membrane protease YdiL (CAAX protease family)
MNIDSISLVVVGVIYFLALVLAVWRRKTFPLTETLPIMLIVGVGFTGIVYLVVPASPVLPQASIRPPELIFVLGYVILVALLLSRKRFPGVPVAWNDNFPKKSFAKLISKLILFVLIPLLTLILIWSRDWPELGFSAGNIPSQLLFAVILILLFGGFNLLAGGGAAPIRARMFSARQVAAGLGIAFLWNILETGLVEEFFFRGMLQTHLVAVLESPLAGIAATSLLFGLFHAPGIYLRKGDKVGPLGEHPALLDAILYTILALSPAGWFAGLLFWRTQSLLAPILVHSGIDAVASAAEFIKGFGLAKERLEK